jgi:hypothetical protein
VFGDWWGWEKHIEDFQRVDFKDFAKHVATLSLRPRTEDNYLRNVCTLFRFTDLVVEIVRNEQDATVAARRTAIHNTLFLVSRDFPTVNKGMADYYSDGQIDGLFAGVSRAYRGHAPVVLTSNFAFLASGMFRISNRSVARRMS